MTRRERLERVHGRALRAGIVVSLVLHGALLALVRSEIPGSSAPDAATLLAPADERVDLEARPIQLVALRVEPLSQSAAEVSAEAVQAASAAWTVPEPVVGLATATAATDAGIASPALLPVPASSWAVPVPGESEPDGPASHTHEVGVALYTEGGVARAKGRWLANGDGDGGAARRGVRVGIGTDGCLVGRGVIAARIPPPSRQGGGFHR